MLLLDADIPDFLRASPYLQSILEEDAFPEEGIDVPEGCAKSSLSIENKADLVDFLRTLRYWLLPELIETSVELLQFSFDTVNRSTVCEVCEEFQHDVPYLACLVETVCADDEHKTAIAVRGGYVILFEYLHDALGLECSEAAAIELICRGEVERLQLVCSRGLILALPMYQAASFHGQLPCLKFLLQRDEFGLDAAVRGAAEGGQFECFLYLYNSSLGGDCMIDDALHVFDALESIATKSQEQFFKSVVQKWGQSPNRDGGFLLNIAARWGLLDLLEWGLHAGVHLDPEGDCLSEAISGGHLACVEYLFSRGHTATRGSLYAAACAGSLEVFTFLLQHNAPVYANLCTDIATSGHLDMLKEAHERGLPWSEGTCAGAALWGHLSCLQYAHQNGCPWNKMTTHAAACHDHLDCLQYAYENSCPWEAIAIGGEHGQGGYYIDGRNENICILAARTITADCLLYILSRGVSLDGILRECAAEALRCQSVEVMRVLHERYNCTWTADDCVVAAGGKSVACLQFLHEIGTPWDTVKCLNTAYSFDCVRYLCEQENCPPPRHFLIKAAYCGDLSFIIYLHQRGCAWSATVCSSASQAGHLACLRYLHENGCPWNGETCMYAKTRSVYNYAVEHGCPGAALSRFKDPFVL